MDTSIYYSENQYFRQWWMRLIQASLFICFSGFVIAQLFFDVSIGNKPVSNNSLTLLWLIFGCFLPLLFQFCGLHIQVRSNGLYIKFAPFHFGYKKIENISSYEMRKFRPLADYGGWGIRYGSQGKAYIVSGCEGVQFLTSDGKKLMIGSQNPHDFIMALNQALGFNPSTASN